MEMLKSKTGKITSGTAEKWMVLFIAVIVLFKIVAKILPDLLSAGDEINATGVPNHVSFTGHTDCFMVDNLRNSSHPMALSG